MTLSVSQSVSHGNFGEQENKFKKSMAMMTDRQTFTFANKNQLTLTSYNQTYM